MCGASAARDDRRNRSRRYRGALAGLAVNLAAVAVALLVALPESVRALLTVVLLNAGLVAGWLAGRLTGGGIGRRVRAGALAGVGGGAALAAVLYASMGNLLPRARGALWAVNYAVATHPIGSPALLAAYDAALAAGIALLVGGFLAGETVLAAAATRSERGSPPRGPDGG